MAEMAVSFALDQLLPLLSEETELLRGIHNEFEDIKVYLEYIQVFLKDADKRAAAAEGDDADEGVKTWVKQVREAAFRLEDIIDDYLIQVGQQPRDRGCVPILHKIAHLLKTMVPRHQLASEIQDVKSYVRGIKERSERYGFQISPSIEQGLRSSKGSQSSKWHDPRTAYLYIDEAEVVGFQAPKNILINWLFMVRVESTVISVVAMGGQGKTTLVKNIFDTKEVMAYFECRVWITVSQSYKIEELLRDMLKELYKQIGDIHRQDISQMDQRSLILELRNYLQQKRYFFIFDDVCNISFWDEIEYALSDNKNGSRILITTRNMDVAMYCKKSSFVQVHELQPLTDEQSLELFNKRAFRFDFDGRCPKELIDISLEITRKCKGLPLAIVAIGGLLSTKKKDAFEWKRFSENMTLELNTGIKGILSFSYNDLPFYLRSCLLYFGMYPEDHKVNAKRLIRQWIAEGFVKEERGNTLEEVAERYLSELIHRGLVQVSSVGIDGKTKSCCVHDLIRMMILEKCEDLSFCKQINEDSHSSLSGVIRRLSITTTCIDIMAESSENSHVRSLVLTQRKKESVILGTYLKRYTRLKMLDFEGVSMNMDTKYLESMIHLKYLNFRRSSVIFGFDKRVGMLQNLETLDLRINEDISKTPKEIGKLRKLRHLMGYKLSLLELTRGGIGGMESLQTLSEVKIDTDGKELIRELGKLRQIRKLSLVCVRKEHGRALSSLLNEMQHLETLRVGSKSKSEFDFEVVDLHLVSSLPMLRKLKLRGKLEKLPEWIHRIPNLTELKLACSKLTNDSIQYLENMQNLLSLSINEDAYDSEIIHFHYGGYQNLKELHVRDLSNLNSIVFHKGTLPSLKRIELSNISNLETDPTGLDLLQNLEILHAWNIGKYKGNFFVCFEKHQY